MEPLDGNAIAGDLFELFGVEMTTASGACVHCGAVAQIAELSVFGRSPGTIVRCRSCGNVVIAVVNVRGGTRINLDWFTLQLPPAAA